MLIAATQHTHNRHFNYQVRMFFKVAYSEPGGYKEPCCLEGSPSLGQSKQSRDVGTSSVEQTLIGCFSVEDSSSITRRGVHISPVGSEKWWTSTPRLIHWEWLGCRASHVFIERDWSIVVDL